MAKASPAIRSFNAGEFSDLLAGRVDLDRYPASLQIMENAIAAPQGPALSRSGTAFVSTVADEAEASVLKSFVFSNEQAVVLEVGSDRIRFFTEDGGLLVYAAQAATLDEVAGDVLLTVVGHTAAVGDQVALSGFDETYGLNGEVANVTAVTGDVLTLSITTLNAELTAAVAVAPVTGQAAEAYHIVSDYTLQERQSLRVVQSVDVMYMFTRYRRPRKLSRFGTYDWRLEDVEFEDGPFLPVNETATTLTPSATGNAVPVMTSDTAPSGTCAGSGTRPSVGGTPDVGVAFAERNIFYQLDASAFYFAFDGDSNSYWASDTAQSGTLQYTPATAFVCDGYVIHRSLDNKDDVFLSKDYAPSTWTFEGFDGTDWVVLDTQRDYTLYENGKSGFFQFENDVAYQAYRIVITNLVHNGQIEARIQQLVMREAGATTFTLTASALTGINRDQGFLSTDVGRLVRLQGSDGGWRAARITAVTSTTSVTVQLLGEPLTDITEIRHWRLGYWSDTTGWPNAGDFFEDRLWLAGSDEAPDMFAGSVVGAYEKFSQTDTFGEVLDDSAVVARLNARKLSRIWWLSSDTRGLLMGTGSEEYTLSAPSNEALTARNARARAATRRGSADVDPVRVDSQVLYVQRGKRTVREFAFVFEADGYRSPSMSQLASHLGAVQFAEMDYAAEPHSIVWVRREDGQLVGLTYNRDENVIGWHRHDFAGGEVESITVIPQSDQLQDALWLAMKRTVNGQTRRYIERLTRMWDFETELAQAHFVDSGLRYEGTPTTEVYGLAHLEGEEVYGLADSIPVGPFTVADGAVTLDYEAANIVLGLGYDSLGVLPRLENGATDGTALGKVKRLSSLVVMVWRSFGGQIGVWNEEKNDYVFVDLEYPGDLDTVEDVVLYSGELAPVQPPPGYDMRGVIAFRRPKENTLPFNPTAILPQLNTQDR